jgi:hypothetical protein
VTLQVETRNVTHDSTVDLDDLVGCRVVAPQPRPPSVETGSIIGIRRSEGGHPDRFAIRPVLEQNAEIPIFDFPKDKLSRALSHDVDGNSSPSVNRPSCVNAVTPSRHNSGDVPEPGAGRRLVVMSDRR